MFRRCFIVLFTLVLVVASTTVTSMAQSGRGRQLRIQGALRSESVAPAAAEVQDDQKLASGFSNTSAMTIRRTRGLIYADAAANQKKDDGEYHMTRADKRAGWILLGFLVLEAAILVHQD
jgi:outer membrane lipoprotein-sorting protein